MILFHGTTEVIKKPDVSFSKNYLDFGKEFYLMTYSKQAEKWALRKALRTQKSGIVNVYELADNLDEYSILRFEKENENWLDFVCACRKGEKIYQKYDIIIGGVANDDVFKTVDMYVRGIWNKQKALNELRYYKMNDDQICIVNQDVLEKKLTYQKSYQVGRADE